MTLSRLQLRLDLLDARVQIIHQVLLFSILCRLFTLVLRLLVCLGNLILQLCDLLLVLLDNFLAEMTAFSKFIFDLFVIFQILCQICNHGLHLMILEHQVFGALRLVV